MGSEDATERSSSVVGKSNVPSNDEQSPSDAPSSVLDEESRPSDAISREDLNEAQESDNEEQPPLPPRPPISDLSSTKPLLPTSTLEVPKASLKPHARPVATTALSLTDIQTQSFTDGSRETYAAQSTVSSPSHKSSGFENS